MQFTTRIVLAVVLAVSFTGVVCAQQQPVLPAKSGDVAPTSDFIRKAYQAQLGIEIKPKQPEESHEDFAKRMEAEIDKAKERLRRPKTNREMIQRLLALEPGSKAHLLGGDGGYSSSAMEATSSDGTLKVSVAVIKNGGKLVHSAIEVERKQPSTAGRWAIVESETMKIEIVGVTIDKNNLVQFSFKPAMKPAGTLK